MDAQQMMDFQTTFHASSNVLDIENTRIGTVSNPSCQISFASWFRPMETSYNYISDGTVLTIYNIQHQDYAEIGGPRHGNRQYVLHCGV